eukprot:g38068.t1
MICDLYQQINMDETHLTRYWKFDNILYSLLVYVYLQKIVKNATQEMLSLLSMFTSLYRKKMAGPSRPVVCVETGVVYPSLSAAARAVGMEKFGKQRIWDAISNKRRAGGFHWSYAEKEKSEEAVSAAVQEA